MAEIKLIELRDVSRIDSNSGRQLLNSLSITVGAGDRIGVVGASGSGKSTLMRSIAMLDPVSGEVLHRGTLITDNLIPSYRRNVVYLSQRPCFTGGTIEENLRLPFQFKSAKGYPASPSYEPDLVAIELEAFALAPEILNRSPESLSGGEQQMLALIRALLLEPEVLLLDEPTTALDPASREKFENRIHRWYNASDNTTNKETKTEKAYLWTSHDPTQVNRMTQKTVTMNHGQLTRVTETASETKNAREIDNRENQQQVGSSGD